MREAKKSYKGEEYGRRRLAGLCPRCGGEKPAAWRYVLCPTCDEIEFVRLRRVAARNGGVPAHEKRVPKLDPAYLEKQKLRQRGARRRHLARSLVWAAKLRSKKKGVPFLLTAVDVQAFQKVIDDGLCQLTGARFDLNPANGMAGPRSPSLDRINPSLGYVPGNVRVVCHAINVGMGTWGEMELLDIVRSWLDRTNR